MERAVGVLEVLEKVLLPTLAEYPDDDISLLAAVSIYHHNLLKHAMGANDTSTKAVALAHHLFELEGKMNTTDTRSARSNMMDEVGADETDDTNTRSARSDAANEAVVEETDATTSDDWEKL